MSKEVNEWESFYQTGSIGWDRGQSSENLNYWLDNDLLKPCRILVPGCGNGYEVTTLAKLGFDVVAIDIAPSAISNLSTVLNEENLTAELILGDFFSWQPEERFDAIFEQTSLCALSPDKWSEYEVQLHQWLKPQGKLFAQFMQTGRDSGPPYHCELTDMHALFSDTKWEWSEEYISQKKEPGKTETLYLLEKRD